VEWPGDGTRETAGNRANSDVSPGDQDLVLGVGEAAAFGTQVPHGFGSTGDGPVEVLSIPGPGERMLLGAAGGVEQQTPPDPPG